MSDDSRECFQKVIESAKAKFNESVDVAVNLGVDGRKSEEQVRGVVVLPNGIGREIRVAVFAHGQDAISEAEEAGADIIGGEDLIEEIKRGKKIDVDWCVTTPDFMVKVSSIAKILGSRGLMPNPKFGTVTTDLAKKVKLIKSGQTKFRTDKNGIVHAKLGNIRFNIDDLLENLKAFVKVLKDNKPSSMKGMYLKSIFISSTMGKAYRINRLEGVI
ncbi:MAG: 50S ribosomal protein L1 [Wolbachia endosymbiont of Fragariocoptes setiger]|nr:50S ribosomal protein L1 [Wolbachia endosymbiont of Fragariocoptes setiger]